MEKLKEKLRQYKASPSQVSVSIDPYAVEHELGTQSLPHLYDGKIFNDFLLLTSD